MSEDEPSRKELRSRDDLLAYLRDKIDDVEKVAVLNRPCSVEWRGNKIPLPPDVRMVLYFVSGGFDLMTRNGADLLLADGVLQRMNIQIDYLG